MNGKSQPGGKPSLRAHIHPAIWVGGVILVVVGCCCLVLAVSTPALMALLGEDPAALINGWFQGAEPAGPTATPAPTPVGGGRGRVIFTSSRDDNDDIYMINSDGSGLVSLTDNRRTIICRPARQMAAASPLSPPATIPTPKTATPTATLRSTS